MTGTRTLQSPPTANQESLVLNERAKARLAIANIHGGAQEEGTEFETRLELESTVRFVLGFLDPEEREWIRAYYEDEGSPKTAQARTRARRVRTRLRAILDRHNVTPESAGWSLSA